MTINRFKTCFKSYIKNYMIRRVIIFSFLFSISGWLGAQTGYDIKFRIGGLSDTTVILGNFYGESTYVKDTAVIDGKGGFSFQGEEKLDRGIYFIVLNKTRLFDFPVNEDQQFSLSTKSPDYILNMQVKGDVDNELFFHDLKYNSEKNEQAQPYVSILQDSTNSEEVRKKARERLSRLNDEVVAHQDELIAEQPESIIAKLIKATRRIDVPEPPEGAPEDFGYNYYKKHYWDNFNLNDPVLLRLSEPVYKNKVNNYLDKLVYQVPDSLIKEVDQLINKAKEDQETYKYATWVVTTKYQYPEIMGLDEVYVHLYDKYFATGEMDFWANDQLKQNLKERAEQLRGSLIGEMAPNLKMLDADLNPKSIYDITNKYTVIYFFDPDCGHCKKETPMLVDFYNSTKFDVEVFAVSADTSMVKMKGYIKNMHMPWITVNGPRTYTQPYQKLYDANTTPTIYVLNERKEIIAKKLPAERLEEFLNRYETVEKATNSKQQ